MSILGHGVDLVDVSEIAGLLALSQDFMERCFTRREQDNLIKISATAERIAGRFAAKEAVLKALGAGFGSGTSFRDIEVFTHPSGAPYVLLNNGSKQLADALGVTQWFISFSHDGGKAIASAIAT